MARWYISTLKISMANFDFRLTKIDETRNWYWLSKWQNINFSRLNYFSVNNNSGSNSISSNHCFCK